MVNKSSCYCMGFNWIYEMYFSPFILSYLLHSFCDHQSSLYSFTERCKKEYDYYQHSLNHSDYVNYLNHAIKPLWANNTNFLHIYDTCCTSMCFIMHIILLYYYYYYYYYYYIEKTTQRN